MLAVLLISILFMNGCQSITGKAIEGIEEKSAPVLGKTIQKITTFTIDDIKLSKGKLSSVDVTVEADTLINLQFKVSIFKEENLLFSQNFDFQEIEAKNFTLPLDTPLNVGRYELQVDLTAGKEVLQQNKIFRMNLWNKF